MHEHDWMLLQLTSPSGKLLYGCRACGLLSSAPVKPQYETRPCAVGRYDGGWDVCDNKVYARLDNHGEWPQDGRWPE